MNPFSVNPNPGSSPPPPPQGPRRPFASGSRTAIWVGVGAASVVAVLALVIALTNGQQAAAPAATSTTQVETTLAPTPTSTPVTEPPTTRPVSTELHRESCVLHELVARGCDLMVAQDAVGTGPLPVVILLHGLAGSESAVRSAGAWPDAVASHRFMLVTPAGVAGSWNAQGCCGVASAVQIDDVGFLRGLIERLTARDDVDASRIYLVGHSNGGMMAYRYLCSDAERIAGMVSVSGTRVSGCFPSAPTDVLQIHGTGDTTVPYDGGQGLVAAILGVTFSSVPSTMQQMAEAQQCALDPQVVESDPVTEQSWTGCSGGAHVDLWSVRGLNHDWMRKPVNLTDRILDYFGID
ncbi:MAG: alpha/beta fold hydrolase [Microthrixaceae bacterium]|nr:alpha/beta fold hydrolase [Microthrixaceae bacterium]HPB44287.1 alpha/beta fold hydrolase [Microthrixaceae bacterium]